MSSGFLDLVCNFLFDFINYFLYNRNKGVELGMGMAVKVKMLLAAKNMSIADLARILEPQTTPQNISVKLKRDNLSEKDLCAIAKACGVSFERYFVLEDGTKI